MSASLCMSMASLAVSGAGRGVTAARMGRAAASKGAVAGSSAFFPAKASAKMTMKSSLAGVVVPRAVAARKPVAGRGALVVVAGGRSLGCTLHGTRRARARTSGFRARLATPGGRRTLKLRRKKGRKYLAPAGAPNMWNKAKRKNLK